MLIVVVSLSQLCELCSGPWDPRVKVVRITNHPPPLHAQCVGPLLWGPLSESFGRRPIFIIAFLGYIGFQVGCALSKNVASILIFRFLGGTFASCPLTNAGALLADIWDADRRGIAMAL